MNLQEAMNLLTTEQLEDAGNREMLSSVKNVKSYLSELEEVEKADKRMKKIDLHILNMPLEKQLIRRRRLDAERSMFNSTVKTLRMNVLEPHGEDGLTTPLDACYN